MNQLLLIRGIPGSGKSTAAEQVREKIAGAGLEVNVVEEDYFWTGPCGEYDFSLATRPLADQLCLASAARSIRYYDITIVCAVLPTGEHVSSYKRMILDTAPDTLMYVWSLAGSHGSVHGVPPNAMRAFAHNHEQVASDWYGARNALHGVVETLLEEHAQ